MKVSYTQFRQWTQANFEGHQSEVLEAVKKYFIDYPENAYMTKIIKDKTSDKDAGSRFVMIERLSSCD
jgi:hypothetical protein